MRGRWWIWFVGAVLCALLPALVLGVAATVHASGEHLDNVVFGLFVLFSSWVALAVWGLGQPKFRRALAVYGLFTVGAALLTALGWTQ